jgi:hypothetical protein
MKLIHSLLVASAAFLSLLDATTAAPNTIRNSLICNNSPDLCDRSYSDITHLGAHDAAFLRDSTTYFSLAGNQFYNATTALNAGVRLIQGQVHSYNGMLRLCHTSCLLLDAGPLENFLSTIKFWMDNNPNDVVTLLLVNYDNNSTAEFGSVFDASGINIYGYVPPSNATSANGTVAPFPTLRTLIHANTRLVSFIASIDRHIDGPGYPYLLNEFTYVFETPFSVVSLSGFNCTLNRPSNLPSASAAISQGFMPLQNHFADTLLESSLDIQVPDQLDISTTNSPSTNTTGSLGTEADKCQKEWGRKPTFILVDFWNVAGPIQVVDKLNGVTNPVGRASVSTDVLQSVEAAATRTSGASVGARGWSELELAYLMLVTLAGMHLVLL